mmetsp:Transcript_98527/g.234619  ORF Transcript_98527/g.234619 Transcript_98527/m.234619 type:complete len:219 (+) Transcript_98527:1379-2035(+)
MGTRASSISSMEKYMGKSANWLMNSLSDQCTRRRTSTGRPRASRDPGRVKQTTSTSLPGVSTRRAALPTRTSLSKDCWRARRQASSTVATKPCWVSRSCCMCMSIAASISMRKTSAGGMAVDVKGCVAVAPLPSSPGVGLACWIFFAAGMNSGAYALSPPSFLHERDTSARPSATSHGGLPFSEGVAVTSATVVSARQGIFERTVRLGVKGRVPDSFT